MKYARLNQNNSPIAFYDTEIHNEIPKDTVLIPDEIWLKHINGMKQVYIDGEWKDYTEPEDVRLEKVRRRKISNIRLLFNKKVNSGYTCSNNITMDSDITDIQKLRDGVELAKSLNQTEMTIRDFNNQLHTLPVADVEQMLIELGVNYQNLLKIKWDLEDQVNQAQSEDELNNIDLTPLQ